MRAAGEASLQDAAGGGARDIHVHRRLVQSAQAAHRDRQHLTHGVRTTDESGRLKPNHYLSTEPGQLQFGPKRVSRFRDGKAAEPSFIPSMCQKLGQYDTHEGQKTR